MIREAIALLIKLSFVMFMIGLVLGLYLGLHAAGLA